MANDLPKTSWKREAPFRLGDLEVLPASCELRTRRGLERLRPLLMDILLRLAAEPGAVVRRETLLEDVWPRRMVNDEVLSRAIAELRTALGDDARVSRYIETLPKLGYRLVAPVESIAAPAEPAPVGAAPPPHILRRRWPWIAGALGVAAVAMVAWHMLSGTPALPDLERRLTTARPFTSDPGNELGPRFSPDGTRVAFVLDENNEARIVVQTLDGSSRQFVGTGSEYSRFNPVFFPDGRRIAYWKALGQECAIVEHNLETGIERKLLDCGLSPRPRFDLSADGRWLVFAGRSRPQYPASLWVLEIDRGAPVALTGPEPGMGDDLVPRFSPDGQRVVFFRGIESHRSPWIVTRGDPASARVAAKYEGLSYGAAWLGPETLLVAADWFGFRALNVLNLASGEGRLAGARGARFPDVGPHGEIVYESAAYSANLWPVDPVRGPAKEPRWRSTRYTIQPEFSRDGTRVTFASNRDGTDAIYVAPYDGEARRIAFGEGFRYGSPHWSADGRSVYAVRMLTAAANTSVQEAVRIPADGGPAEVLAPLGHSINDVREGDDGKLYWAELSDHAMRLLRAPLSNLARAERLPLPLVSQYQLSADRIAFLQPQLDKLTICRLDTLSCTPSPLAIAETGVNHWTITQRSLYSRVVRDNTIRLARFDLATGALARTWDIFPSGAGVSIAVSPDERKIIVVQEEGPVIDLMIAR